MAIEGLAASRQPTRSRLAPWVAEAGFVALLLLVFVGLTPFPLHNPAVPVKDTGAGDLMRQVSYLAAFALIFVAAYDRRAFNSFAVVPLSIALLLGWCFLSTTWAQEPGIAARRAVLELIVVLSVMLSVDTIGAERALRLWSIVLALTLIVNWISIPLIPQAVHLASEGKPQLVGDWRGLYQQKNTAGAVTALSALIFFYYFLRQRSWLYLALFAAALGFLAMTRSKTSIGFLPVALVMAAAYRLAWRRDMDRWFVALGALFAGVLAVAAIVTHMDWISQLLHDPTAFTGRTQVWQAVWGFIRAHPLLGAGYGAFSNTGGVSPLNNYIQSQWVTDVYDSHNGYLQLLATIGLPGFLLAMIALVAIPLHDFWRRDPANLALKALLFGYFVFCILHNFLETDYLENDAVSWVSFLIVIAMMRTMRLRAPAAEGVP